MNHLEYIEHLKNKLHDKFFNNAPIDKANERFTHSLGVMKIAKEMASLYKPNDEDFYHKCEIAGLLHDYGKFLSRTQYEELTKKYHIDFEYKEEYRQVYHGYYGYLAVIDELGIHDDDIIKGIKNHIMGAQNMGLLEKIIYVSDLIEEGRSEDEIPILKPLRNLALSGKLDQAVAFESKHVIEHLVSRNIPVHPVSLECYNSYIKYLKKEDI